MAGRGHRDDAMPDMRHTLDNGTAAVKSRTDLRAGFSPKNHNDING
jgi:hypothetical protein